MSEQEVGRGCRVRAEATGAGPVLGAPGLFTDFLPDPLLTSDVSCLTAVGQAEVMLRLRLWIGLPVFYSHSFVVLIFIPES